MADMPDYTVIFASTAGWYKIDQQLGAVKLDVLSDPLVIHAKQEKVRFMLGKDFLLNAADTEPLNARIIELEAEVSTLQGRLTMSQAEALTLRATNVQLSGAANNPSADEFLALRQELEALKERFFDASYENAENENAFREEIILLRERAVDAAYACAVDEQALLEGSLQLIERNTQLQDDVTASRLQNADLSTAKTNLEAEVVRLNALVVTLNARPAPAAAPAAAPVAPPVTVVPLFRRLGVKSKVVAAAVALVLIAFTINGMKHAITPDSTPQAQTAQQAPPPAATTTPAPNSAPVQLAANCDAVKAELAEAKEDVKRVSARASRLELNLYDANREYGAARKQLDEANAELAKRPSETAAPKTDAEKNQGRVAPAPQASVVQSAAPQADDSRCSAPGMKFSRVANRCLFVR